jgi:hypothetical protein
LRLYLRRWCSNSAASASTQAKKMVPTIMGRQYRETARAFKMAPRMDAPLYKSSEASALGMLFGFFRSGRRLHLG